MSLLPVEEATERLLALVEPIKDIEVLPLDRCDGRMLASPLSARLTQPPFDASAMDGYALRQSDLVEKNKLLIIGESAAGHAFSGVVNKGQAVRIFTGAPVPEGADTVLLQEDAERAPDDTLTATFSPPKGRHIRPRGQDFIAGEEVLQSGATLDPTRLMVAAAMNHDRLGVYRRPHVVIMATGDELVTPGSAPGADQIVASNNFAIAAIARNVGAVVTDLGIVPDSLEALQSAIQKVRNLNADILVTLGGASVGDHDLVQRALTDAGMKLDFWRIAMRPGKPLMAGKLDDMLVLGLPGNPVSSLVCALLFMQPALRHMSHLSPEVEMIDVIVTKDLGENDKRRDHLRAKLSRAPDGALLAEPFEKQDSSMMKILAQSGCLIVRQPFAAALKAGDTAKAILLRAPEMA